MQCDQPVISHNIKFKLHHLRYANRSQNSNLSFCSISKTTNLIKLKFCMHIKCDQASTLFECVSSISNVHLTSIFPFAVINMSAHTNAWTHTYTHTHRHLLEIPPNHGQYDTQCIQSIYYRQSGTQHYHIQHAIADTLCISMTIH